jgi:tetratricopeptide (TPR) repeat protein
MKVKFLLNTIAVASITAINLVDVPVWGVNFGKTHDLSKIPVNTLAHYDIDELEGVEKRIRANPNDAEAYLHRAMIRSHSQEDFAGAIEDFNKAIQLDPNNAEAYNYRGTSYFWLKDYQKAMADYDRAIRLAPNLALAYYNRAYVRLEMGDKQGAIADFQQGATLSKKEGDMMSYDQAQQMIQDLQ